MPSSSPRFQLERVYDELRELAGRRVRQGLAGNSLQATALVHEVWLKLSQADGISEQDSQAFHATAAQAMRWILVDRARRRRFRESVDEQEFERVEARGSSESEELLAMDEALERLSRTYPRAAEVVLLRYFAGLSVKEAAGQLGLSEPTIKREWRFAKAWLLRDLGNEPGEKVYES